ncbi:hypothetical protein SKAU_G00304130 [Synaphobranchus kaupii]|uniref:Uncharacterized protein n=1 Tax=Synaphobranchus kaupii TaxID=118154 RepID=A0A9Q1EWA2_SYNKA|nr:hypothetical protein SKAU_G00304130 [Synaphobranchus kaupii]
MTLFQTSSERAKDKGTNTIGSRLNRMEEKVGNPVGLPLSAFCSPPPLPVGSGAGALSRCAGPFKKVHLLQTS